MVVTESRIISWLEPLIAFDTRNATGDEMVCVKWLAEQLSQFSPDSLIVNSAPRSRGKSDSGYVLATWGQPKILLNVHIDTVPSGEGWESDPHVLRKEGGRYIGLGTSDIKGAAACILAGLEVTTPKDVAILFSGDEEHGSEIMPVAIKDNNLGAIPNAIVCEPTYKGLCLNIGQITCDGSYNVIPTQAALKFSLRPPPGDNVARHLEAAKDMLSALYPDAKLYVMAQQQPFQSRAPEILSKVCGGLPAVDLPFWTEAALLSEAGVNAVVFGPGHVDQAHKPNEYVEGSQLLTAAKVYQAALAGINL